MQSLEFIELKVIVPPDFAEIIMAELAEIGYESFVDTEQGLDAYIQASLFNEIFVKDIKQKYENLTSIVYTFSTIEKRNWNEEWEKSYQPIEVGKQCLVRASFHPSSGQYPYEIIITPKMSFGTGHHETTSLMLENQLAIPHQNKSVLDVGCGTGILAIMAAKLGASVIDAFDIDEWAVENTIENCALNDCSYIRVQQGTIKEVELRNEYEIILANINRNILLQEISVYARQLAANGILLISGFYVNDVQELEQKAMQHLLQTQKVAQKNNWACIIFSKRQ